MNYLSDLLDHLDAQELAALNSLSLTSKERQVLDLLLATPDLTRESATEMLSLSGSHYDKLCSSVLNKCYEQFASRGGVERLDFLKLKGLWAHLEHEFKKLEKQLSDEEKPAFYFTALRHLALYTYDRRYLNLVEKCMEKTLSFDNSPAMNARIEAMRMHIMVYTGYSVALTPEDHGRLYEKARAHRQVVDNTGDTLALLFQLCAEAQCRMLEFEGDLAIELLEQALTIIDDNPDLFLQIERMRVLAYLAESYYYYNRFAEARERYMELFNGAPINLHSPHYHAVKCAQVLMGLDDLDGAEALLERWYPLASFKSNDRRSASGAVTFVKVYLAKGDVERARFYLQLGYQANIKAEVIPYEVQLRVLEALTYLITGEYDIAAEIFDKVIRYARDKEMIKSATLLPPVFLAASMLIRSRAELTPLDPEFDVLLSKMASETKHAEVFLRKLRELSADSIRTKTTMAAM